MSTQNHLPRVGVGVIIVNSEGNVLIGKRKSAHAPYYSIPGGHLDLGETFENCAVREVKEETDLDIYNPRVIAVTNNLETYRDSGIHYVSIILMTREYSGILCVVEPAKCEEWMWSDPRNLPTPHFDASRMGIACYLEGNITYAD